MSQVTKKKQYKILELKQRVNSITTLIDECLPYSYETQLEFLINTLIEEKIDKDEDIDFSWENLPKKKIAGFTVGL